MTPTQGTKAFTRCPKWTVRAIARGDFSKREAQVFAWFLDQVCGWAGREGIHASASVIAVETGIQTNKVYAILDDLINRGYLVVTEFNNLIAPAEDDPRDLSQKGIEVNPKKGLGIVPKRDKALSQKGTGSYPKKGQTLVPKRDNIESQKGTKPSPKKGQILTWKVPSTDDIQAHKESIKENKKENSKENSKENIYITASRKRLDYADDFARFWVSFPNCERKKQKAEAWKAWQKYRLSPDEILRLLDALDEDKRSSQWTQNGGQYIPAPATWLNKQRWLDDPVVVDLRYAGGPDNVTNSALAEFMERNPDGDFDNERL